jgi:hypothetical protein
MRQEVRYRGHLDAHECGRYPTGSDWMKSPPTVFQFTAAREPSQDTLLEFLDADSARNFDDIQKVVAELPSKTIESELDQLTVLDPSSSRCSFQVS